MVIGFALLTGCSPKISKTISKSIAPLDYRQEVIVFDLDDSIPANSIEVGTLKIGDTGFTVNCGWERMLNDAKLETRKMGGNALKIVKHGYPNPFGSNCHRITANVLVVDESACKAVVETIDSTLLKSNYALIHLFRTGSFGSLINYDVHLGDSVIWRASANTKITVKVTTDGLNSIWAKTESKSEVPVNIKIGQEYYVRCGVTMGAFVGRPKIEILDNIAGKQEFKGLKSR